MENRYVFAIEVEDKPGVLTRISSLFSRRGFNIESLTVANTHLKGISRFTVVVTGDRIVLEQIRKQTQKLIHVLTIKELSESNADGKQAIHAVTRELTILKLAYTRESSAIINRVVDFYGGGVLDNRDNKIVVEFTGSEEKINRIQEELEGVTILESIRTGKLAMNL